MVKKMLGYIFVISFALGCIYMTVGIIYNAFFTERIQRDIDDLKSVVSTITELDKYEVSDYGRVSRKATFAKMIVVRVNAKNTKQLENREKIVEEINNWFLKNNWKKMEYDDGTMFFNDKYNIEVIASKNSKINRLFSLYISHNDFWEKYNL